MNLSELIHGALSGWFLSKFLYIDDKSVICTRCYLVECAQMTERCNMVLAGHNELTNVNKDQWHPMASLGHNELTTGNKSIMWKLIAWPASFPCSNLHIAGSWSICQSGTQPPQWTPDNQYGHKGTLPQSHLTHKEISTLKEVYSHQKKSSIGKDLYTGITSYTMSGLW